MRTLNLKLAALVALAALVLVPVAVGASQSPPDKRFKVVLARIVSLDGKRHLQLRVNGPARTVKVNIILSRANGRMLSATVHRIRTNHRLVVPHLLISAKARAIHVRILGHVG